MLLASVLAAAGAGASAQQRSGARIQPNVLLITLDDVGTDKLAMYGESDAPQYAQAPYCGILAHPLPYPPTPSLDRLAAGSFPGLLGGGLRFDQAYAAPVCCVTRGALNTGRYGLRNGLGVVDDGAGYRKRMKNSEVLIAELLRQGFAPATAPGAPRRYRCGAFGKWHMTGLAVCDPVRTSDFSHPILNGFHVFKGTMGNPGVAVSNPGDHYDWTQVLSTPTSVELLRREVGASAFVGPFQFSAACTVPGTLVRTTSYSPESFTASVTRADAVEWINAQPSAQPYFAYVNFHAPHFPYQLPPFELLSPATRAALQDPGNCGGPYCPGQEHGTAGNCGSSSCGNLSGCPSTQIRLFYSAMLEAVDTEIGNLLAQIDPVKRANTMVFIVSDNGTPGAVIEPLLHDTGRGKGTMYESGVRIPMLVAGPLVPRGAHATEALVHVVDVWRTLADVTGASETRAAPLQPLDSISFRNQLVRPGSPSARTEVFTQGFELPGGYQPTEVGPYELGCQDPTTPGVYVWAPQNTGEHGRSLRDARYKLIVIQTAPGQESLPAGTPDTPPQYREELYDLLLDPGETNDLAPLVGTDPGVTAVRDQLRARITQLSGF
ncbi:MAG TPA: sulfatase-like hydrolase/transferase [Planctomycetota bacterium]